MCPLAVWTIVSLGFWSLCVAQVTEEWVARYNGTGNGNDKAFSIVEDGSGNVYLTGRSEGTISLSDYVTIKYSQSVGVEEGTSDSRFQISDFRLFQNHPNPFHFATIIPYSLPAVGARRAVPVQLMIYDITGRLVETLVDEPQMPGIYQLPITRDQLPGSGSYFYRLRAGDFTATKKFILLK